MPNLVAAASNPPADTVATPATCRFPKSFPRPCAKSFI